MRSKGNAPTEAQKQWMKGVRRLGSVVSGGAAVVHHAVGRTGKHNKIHIGHWWLIPMTDEEHKALHSHGATFGHESRKAFEKAAFERVFLALWGDFDMIKAHMPGSAEVKAIASYHK